MDIRFGSRRLIERVRKEKSETSGERNKNIKEGHINLICFLD